jgi:hypothetical protein
MANILLVKEKNKSFYTQLLPTKALKLTNFKETACPQVFPAAKVALFS